MLPVGLQHALALVCLSELTDLTLLGLFNHNQNKSNKKNNVSGSLRVIKKKYIVYLSSLHSHISHDF